MKLEGFKELDAELAKLSKSMGKAVLRRSGIKALGPTAALAASIAPVATGELKGSIAVSAKAHGAGSQIGKSAYAAVMRGGGSKAQAVAALRDVRRNTDTSGVPSVELFMGPAKGSKRLALKAIAQEFGTIKQPPHSFMRPAWDQDQAALLGRLKKDLWDEVRKSVARAAKRAGG